MPKLHIVSGVLEGKVIDLIEERITIGRALDNMVRLEDGTVSHHHATLFLEGSEYKIRDLNSTNGTRVNGLRVVENKLHNGDQVRLGSVEMRFESEVKPSSRPMPPTQTGIDLREVGIDRNPQPTFPPSSSFKAIKPTRMSSLIWVVTGLGIAAVGLLVWFFVKLNFLSTP